MELIFNKCCGTCKYFVEDRSHPSTDHNSISNIKGYACVVFLPEGFIFSEWTVDGYCEEYKPKND